MMGPLKVVHTPRLQRLMRGVNEPYLRRPLVQMPTAIQAPGITPWFEGMGAVDFEYGASMQPRNNPAFDDAWVVGATGGASKVIPQGIDYSRTPCCMPMGDTPSTTSLYVGLVAIPLLFFGFSVLGEVLTTKR